MFRRQTGLISRVISSSQCPSLDTIVGSLITILKNWGVSSRWDPMWFNHRAYTTEKGIRTSSCEQDWETEDFCPLLFCFDTCAERKKVTEQDRNISFYPLLSKETLLSRNIHLIEIYIFCLSFAHTFHSLLG